MLYEIRLTVSLVLCARVATMSNGQVKSSDVILCPSVRVQPGQQPSGKGVTVEFECDHQYVHACIILLVGDLGISRNHGLGLAIFTKITHFDELVYRHITFLQEMKLQEI